MARVAAYVRRSTEGEEDKNTSIETQLERIDEWVAREGHERVAVFSDPGGKSYSLDRPGLNDLFLAARRHEFDVVACWRFDRFSRDEEQAFVAKHTLKECGAKVISITQPIEDGPLAQVEFALHNFASAQELKGIRMRVAEGKRKRIQSGKLPAAGVPKYGYRFTGEKKERYELDPETAPVVARIFAEFVGGKTIRGIAALLTSEGVPTPTVSMARAGVRYRKGKTVLAWRVSTVHKILNTRSYTGKHEGNVMVREPVQIPDPLTSELRTVYRRVPRSWESGERVTYDASVCPPIISEELFEEVHTRLHENKERSARNLKHPGDVLLRGGIAVCGYCGRPLVAEFLKKGQYYRYICQARKNTPDACPGPRFSADARVVDKEVWDTFVAWLTSPEKMQRLSDIYVAEAETANSPLASRLAGLESALAEAQAQEENYLDAVGTLPVGHTLRVEYLKRAEDAHEKVLARTAALEELRNRHLAIVQRRAALQTLVEVASDAQEQLAHTTTDQKRQFLYMSGAKVQMWGQEHYPHNGIELFGFQENGEVVSMPTYEYLCESCGHRFEVFQHIADTPLTTCPNCSGHIHRVLFPAGIVFKGSGFYKTDSRGTSSASTPPPAAAHDAGSPAPANGKSAQPAEKTEAKAESKSESAAKSDSGSASGASASN